MTVLCGTAALNYTSDRPLFLGGQDKRSNNTSPFLEWSTRLNMQQAKENKTPQKTMEKLREKKASIGYRPFVETNKLNTWGMDLISDHQLFNL
jgi:hypothetical protein